ncbi:hypothetical protein [Plantactinospora sp. WMMB782]|uniref:hypothetical protein n=1 Tax=Plantactinospora sp. WMMB782 TaxID=3404121 RepID=UPI003B9474BD
MTATLPPNLLRTVDQTREAVPLPGPSSPAWQDPSTVWRIALFRERHVDPAAHDLAHPQPIWGCDFCPQSGVCPQCAMPSPECADSSGHRREAAGSESSWRGGGVRVLEQWSPEFAAEVAERWRKVRRGERPRPQVEDRPPVVVRDGATVRTEAVAS